LTVARRGISRTFQHNALFKHLSVVDNVMAGLTRQASTNILEHTFSLPRARAEEQAFRKRVLSVLNLLGIAQHANAVVATLPYGVQKRVDFARALVSSPKLLLLDEPLAGMNHDEKREMSHFIRDVNERAGGVTVVLIEHDIASCWVSRIMFWSSTTDAKSVTAHPTKCAPIPTSSPPTSARCIEVRR
jgi:branched-chain amino acid transport system ATP-binding protein